MNSDAIKELLDLVQAHDLAEFELEDGGFKLRVKTRRPSRRHPRHAGRRRSSAAPRRRGGAPGGAAPRRRPKTARSWRS